MQLFRTAIWSCGLIISCSTIQTIGKKFLLHVLLANVLITKVPRIFNIMTYSIHMVTYNSMTYDIRNFSIMAALLNTTLQLIVNW